MILILKTNGKILKKKCDDMNILIYGDESVTTWDKIHLIKDYVHGVNIKLEKAGGIRGALKAIHVAKDLGLKVWLGSMVSSRLSCSCSAHLLSLSDIGGDLDGGLLVNEESQLYSGGMEWFRGERLGEVGLGNNSGVGVIKKDIN